MNAFYSIETLDYSVPIVNGVVVGEDEGSLMQKVIKYYGRNHIKKVTFWFSDFDEADVVEIEDFEECPLFDFKKKS